MLTYVTSSPIHHSLHSSIRTYAHIAGEGAKAKTIAPRPGAILVINIKGSFRVDDLSAPVASVAGIRERPFRFDPDSLTTDRLHVLFSPCGLTRFTTVSAHLLKNRSVSAEEVFSAPALHRLISSLSGSKGFEERVAILDRFFLDLYSPPDKLEEAVQDLANGLCNDPGVSLGTLLHEMPMSLRQTERNFNRLVGLSPRAFLRVARFEQAKAGVLANSDKTLTEVGLEAGYYDQSHFNREFRCFSSMPPGSYSFCAPPVPPNS